MKRPALPPPKDGARTAEARAGLPGKTLLLGHSGCARAKRFPRRAPYRKEPVLRSHFSLLANQRRGSVNRSPQGEIRGGFAVSPQNSGRFARCACLSGALARARRQRRASSMSAAWDSSPALCPVPWGERSREAFNSVPGDQQSAPLINSFGVRDGAEPVDHRGDGSRGATNGARVRAWRAGRATLRSSAWSWAAMGLLAAGALSQRAPARSLHCRSLELHRASHRSHVNSSPRHTRSG